MVFGAQEIVLIFIIVIILFGAAKIPELARSLGKATGEFKKGKQEIEQELTDLGKSIKEGKPQANTSYRVRKMAPDLGITTEGKSDEQLLDEIQKTMKK